MKLLSAVISSALAAREPDAERRLEKITARATELNAFVQSYDKSSQKQKDSVDKWVTRLLADLNNIDTSKCPLPAEEDRYNDEIDTIEDLCSGAERVPSMIRSYARRFGCVEGFPKRKFLEKVIKRSHKLKKVALRAGRCNKPAPTTEPTPTEEPSTLAPVTGVCDADQHAVCSSLGNSEIFFENEWTCRNCFRIRAYYGTGGGFTFNPRKDFVSIKFTEPVYFQKWNHPIHPDGPVEVAGSNKHHWKMNFKEDGNFLSGMMFDAELITSDLDLWVDGQWIIDSAQSCRCKDGPPPPPECVPADPCSGRENCEAFVDSCGITPSRNNNIATTTGSPAFKVSAEVKCGEIPDDWQNIIHINAGSRWDVLGDRYFALFAGPETMKFSAPLKNSGNVPGGGNFMVNHYPSCTPGEWNKYQVEQRYTDAEDTLELTMSIDDEVFVTRIVDVADAYSGDLFVDVSNDYHDSATGFEVRNFYHQTFPEAEPCDPVDPCEGRDNCDTLVDSCSIRPQHSTQIGSVEGNAVYSASVDVFCRRTEGHSWQSVVHMTQGGYRENFGDRYFTIWQRDDGKLKINAPLKGNTQFDEVEYFVDCEDNSWTNIAVKQTQIDFGRLELTVFQDENALGSNIIHHTDAFVGPVEVWSGNSWFEPASFFKIKNFVHSSRPYEPEPCDATDPCEGLESCETFQDSCGVAPFRGNRLAESNGHLGFKISAEVQCTDRVAPSWENVLHVHTGTNRENFGDRYFTIWKEANKPDGIRIVAPAFENPLYELNAYVSCSPGWHTFTVQQSESSKNYMLLEILMDGVVVESQEVRKTDTYQGPLFVEASNEFAWPAAYDHVVRNFYHQDITCYDPCEGKDNCETFIDSCAINPVRNNRLTNIVASVNHVTSVDVLCTYVESSSYMNFVQITNESMDGNPGNRFFVVNRRPDSQGITVTFNNPDASRYMSGTTPFECVPGEWYTFQLEQRQDEANPAVTNMVVTINGDVVKEVSTATSGVINGGEFKVMASNKWNSAAEDYSIRNFYYQTFEEVPYCFDPCDGEDGNCQTLVDSCEINPSQNNQLDSITASVNFDLSFDLLCSNNMAHGEWTNILWIVRARDNQRMMGLFKNSDDHRLRLNTANPEVTGTANPFLSKGWSECTDGEWSTIRYHQQQNAANPAVTDVTVTNNDEVVISASFATGLVTKDEELEVFVSNHFNPSGSDYAIRNFVYKTSEENLGSDPCDGKANCVTLINSYAQTPAKNNQIGSITAAINFEVAANVLCTDEMDVDEWYNLIHMTIGGNNGELGDRFFKISQKRGSHELMINMASPEEDNGTRGTFHICTPGEWNEYKLVQAQNPDWPSHTYSTVYVDGVEIFQIRSDTHEVLNGDNIDVFFSDNWHQSADAYHVQNFYYQTFADIDYGIIPLKDCREETLCEIVGDDSQAAIKDYHVATVTAAVNFGISVDVLCEAMPVGNWYNLIHMTMDGNNAVLGDRFFLVSQHTSTEELLIDVADPNQPNGSSGRRAACPAGEWITIEVDQSQDASDPSVTTFTVNVDGVEIYSRSAATEAVLASGEVQVYVSDPWHRAASSYQIKRFVYERFADVPLGPQNCNDVDNCVIVGADSVSPVQGNLAATITAVKNYKFSIDIKCDHSLPFDGFKNIFHVTTGPNDGVYGSRQFAIWRSSNENKMHITTANPKAAGGHSRNYFNCIDGEWNTYTFEQHQQAPNRRQWIWFKLSIDGVRQYSKRFNDDDYPVLDGEQMNVWISNEAADAASTFEIRNFSYEKYPDL
ncbi:Oidioi.mRNA.OKI2018_I69.chr1.g1601.t1.cds [Oikopleura dioica]|uniref:Oidioi.mRNA.OKI2018_I69.chr1.g1601.t1.cds n=1 Tax=Oikopleura dioica TaxID=34765 RepID=A0ABN7SNX7_OIKDI|nr:Oidioi.mRNA.OKI2018_I69.chr1.g1601.t1.cds [Oikopleura dioica]